MNPNIPSPEQPKSKEAASAMQGMQFKDGRIGMGTSQPGKTFDFDGKYSNPASRVNVVLVKTKSGIRYALGAGVMAEMPELDHETGKFGVQGQKLKAVAVADLPGGVLPITIGEPWPTLGNDDPVELVMHDYKNSEPDPSFYQVDMPNPFDDAKEHLQRVSEAIEARQQPPAGA